MKIVGNIGILVGKIGNIGISGILDMYAELSQCEMPLCLVCLGSGVLLRSNPAQVIDCPLTVLPGLVGYLGRSL